MKHIHRDHYTEVYGRITRPTTAIAETFAYIDAWEMNMDSFDALSTLLDIDSSIVNTNKRRRKELRYHVKLNVCKIYGEV
jgi:hypothetical protein